jgi:LysM repeat protein
MGLPNVPRVGMLAVALLLAAVGLFFLPTLLGVGGPAGSPAPSATAPRSAAPSATAGSSIVAAPTPQLYEVQPGDTMSRIAAKLGVPLTALIEANKDKYPDPNKLAIGDLLVIPAPPPTSFTDPRTSPGAASP